jgi:hypothetical protein
MKPNKQEVLACLHAFLASNKWTAIGRKKVVVYKAFFYDIEQKVTLPPMDSKAIDSKAESQMQIAIVKLADLYNMTFLRFVDELKRFKKGSDA